MHLKIIANEKSRQIPKIIQNLGFITHIALRTDYSNQITKKSDQWF